LPLIEPPVFAAGTAALVTCHSSLLHCHLVRCKVNFVNLK